RMNLATNSSTAPLIPNGTGQLTGDYDFNGNGMLDANAYILDGRQCLTLFLGGIPTFSGRGVTSGMSGFSRNPQNPFLNNVIGNANYSNNRAAPFFEFSGNRLQMLPEEVAGVKTPPAGIPAYGDPNSSSTAPNFYAYFSAYGSSNYDPNDVN